MDRLNVYKNYFRTSWGKGVLIVAAANKSEAHELCMKDEEYAGARPAKKQAIWHDAKVIPSENSKIVVTDTHGEWYNISYSFNDYDDCFGKGWESCVRTYNIYKWAYLNDLINL